MEHVLQTEGLTKDFGAVAALENVNLALPAGTLTGLVGSNGSGKTTLFRLLLGLYLPTEGICRVLGHSSAELEAGQLEQIGVVHQEHDLVGWMTVRQHLRYVASFYRSWDRDLEEELLRKLRLTPGSRVSKLSTGQRQVLSLILAVGHHPRLLLLDEPVSALDPLARNQVLTLLVDLLREDGSTIFVSSHVLRDIESIVDRVVCLHQGRMTVHAPLDDLRERYTEWHVHRPDGRLPEHFPEPYLLDQWVNHHQARLVVRADRANLEDFRTTHGVEVEIHPLNLEKMFPYLIREAV